VTIKRAGTQCVLRWRHSPKPQFHLCFNVQFLRKSLWNVQVLSRVARCCSVTKATTWIVLLSCIISDATSEVYFQQICLFVRCLFFRVLHCRIPPPKVYWWHFYGKYQEPQRYCCHCGWTGVAKSNQLSGLQNNIVMVVIDVNVAIVRCRAFRDELWIVASIFKDLSVLVLD